MYMYTCICTYVYKYILCMTRERKKRLIRTDILGLRAFPTLVSSISFSKMLHFIRDATFHLHWRSFREKVSLTHDHSLVCFITNDTLLLQHASDVFIFFFFCSETLSMAKGISVESTIEIWRVKSSFHVHSTKAMCDDWKISTEARNGISSLQKLKISEYNCKLYE